MKSSSILILLSLIAIISISGCAQYGQQSEQIVPTQEEQTPAQEQSTTPIEPTIARNSVEITSIGFNPNTLTIGAGETVTWINKDTVSHWPASAIHPTHTAYPEAGGCIGSKFDACKALAQGESYSFTFNQKGTWRYHDHLNPGLTGTIIVVGD